MNKFKFLSLAVAAVLCAGFVSCGDDDDEPQNPATENTGGASGDGGNSSGYTPANPEVDEYGIAVSQEVDLGLSVNWAGWYIDATKPEEKGGLYAWGETEEKSVYDWSTYKWCNGSSNTMTKYCCYSNCGTVDNKSVLELDDDVAHVKWGNGWRMPTRAEMSELHNSCTWEWITYNGVEGYKVTGKELSNGKRNSIFMLTLSHWGSTVNTTRYDSDQAYVSDYSKEGKGFVCRVASGIRYVGQSVRAVKDK